MKNKIVLGVLSLALCFTLVGCNNSASTMTKTNISSQLDKTNNSIATVKSVSTSDIEIDESKLNNIENESKCEKFKYNMARAQATLDAEQNYKNEILHKTTLIKKHLQGEDLKLAKGELNALKDLTANLSNYNDNVARSSNEFNSTYRNYNTMKKSASRNIDRVSAKLNKITCNSNTRCSYYVNILNTLQNMEDILGIEDYNNLKENFEDDNIEFEIDDETEDIYIDNGENGEENLENINNDTGESEENKDENEKTIRKKWRLKRNIDTYKPEELDNEPITNETTRNADTYAPFRRNIDTFRPYGYGMYGMNGYGYGNYYNRGLYSPYGYNSNNFNRLAQPVNTEMDEDEEHIVNEEREKDGIENSLNEASHKILNRENKINDEREEDRENNTNLNDVTNNIENIASEQETKIKSVANIEIKEIDDNEEHYLLNKKTLS